jgi:hypothetical protein
MEVKCSIQAIWTVSFNFIITKCIIGDTGASLDRNGNRRAPKKRMNDGTSSKEIQKAMATYLNKTGAGDYNLPKLTGEKIIEGNRRN